MVQREGRMNFNHLLIFHKVAEKRHFTRAAEELFISQPAVSKQIAELEKQLGQPLFVQVGRKIHLTEAGQILYDYATRIFALSTEAEVVLDELHDLKRGRLAVGASTTIGIYLLPELLGEYRSQYAQIELFLAIANAEEIQERLLAHSIEVGLVEGAVTHAELASQEWRQDELVLITSVQRPTIVEEGQSIRSLLTQNIPFILREPGSGTRTVLEDAIAAQGMQAIHPFLELGSTEAIKKAVIAGLGVSFVSQHTIGLELAAGLIKSVPVPDFKLTRFLYLVYPKQKRLSKAAQTFIKLIN